MKLLRFESEEQMYYVLGDVPHSPFGVVRVRGVLGTPGVYEDRGEVDDEGNPAMTEIQPPQPWPGYHAEIDCESLPEELAAYAVT